MEQVSLLRSEHKDLINKYRRIVKHFSENSRFLRLVMDETRDAIFIKDLEGRYLIVNSVVVDILKLPLKEIIGKKDSDFISDNEIIQVREEDEIVVNKGKSHIFVEAITIDSEKRYYVSIKGVYVDKKNKAVGLISLCRDVSDRVKIEQSLRKSEERYKKLFERVPIGLYHTTASGKFLMANPTMISMMGFSSFEELSKVNLNDEKIGPTYSRQEFYKMIEQEEEIKGFEANWIKKNGELMFVRENVGVVKDDDGNVLYYQGSAEDLTKHRANEEALSMLATIIESSPDAIIVRDLEGKIIHWNYGAQNLYGYSAKEILGKPILLLVPEGKEEEIAKNSKSVRSGLTISNYETVRVRKSGELVDVFVSVCPIRNSKGEIIAIASNARDITEKKLYEKQREMLIAIASHELKTPITTIRAFTQVLQKHNKSLHNSQTSRYLSKMSQQIDKLTRLTRDLLDVIRIRGGKLIFHKTKTDLYKLINSVVEDIQKSAELHKILVRGKSAKFVYADQGRVSQVISNLIFNAIKYSPNANKVIVSMRSKKDSFIVGIKDFGIGIDKNLQGDVFRSFTRLNNQDNEVFPGLGLGLFIASEIIAAHGGKIWVKSKKGEGSTFYFSLPFYSLKKISREKEYLSQKLQIAEYTTMPVSVN